MRVVIVMNSAYGVKILRTDLIRFILSKGHKITVVCSFENSKLDLEHLGVSTICWDVSRSGMNFYREFRSLIQLRRILMEIDSDVILNFTSKAIIYGSIAAILAGKKNVVSTFSGLGYLFTDNHSRRSFQRLILYRFLWFVLRRNVAVCFHNPDDRELFTKNNIVLQSRTFRVYGSGVDTVKFCPSKKKRESSTTTFIMVSRILKHKGVFEYIGAAQLLKSEGLSVRALLVGPFDNHPSAINRRTIAKHELAGAITYLDAVEDVRPYLEEADVFVLPSYREGTSRATLEAMSMAKPIITTNEPGCRETVKDSYNGYLIPSRDHISLAATMRKFIGNDPVIKSMGAQSRKMAQKLYDVNRVNDRFWSNVI